MQRYFGWVSAEELAEAKEAARKESRRAIEKSELAEQEKKAAAKAKEEADASARRAEEADEQAQREKQRANEEMERAEQERKAAAKAKEEADASARRAEEADEQAQREKQRANEEMERAEQERMAAFKAKEEADASARRAGQADEQAQREKQRADEEMEHAEQERMAAFKAKEEADASARRAEQADEQGQREKQRADEEMEHAEQERMATFKAKEEADASARRAEQADEQAQKEKQRAHEAQEMAKEHTERAEEARAHAENEARKSEEMRQKKETAELENQRLLDEKEEKQRRDEKLMQFSWGPKNPDSLRWTTQGVEELRTKLFEHIYDKEGKRIRGKVLIFGPSGAGKSSFCNGLRSALKDSTMPSTYYAVGSLDQSLTQGFQVSQYGDHWIIDMPGIFESSEFKTENIEAIAYGRVPFYAQITKFLEMRDNLSQQDARSDVSCVVLVLPHGITLGDELKRQLNAIIRLGGQGVLSYHLVLTNLDECDPQFKDPGNLPNLYTSPLVQEAVKMMSEQTGIPPYAISYVKNYVRETETDTNTKLLHLRTLDRILTSTVEQVEKMTDFKLRETMYDDEEIKVASEERKVERNAWTIPVLTSAAVIGLCAVVYMFTQQM
ncbi:caldesmon-like isoform X1 [Haliotis cracherodii]|uniref:caldesmon-like isoform X1 n=1 Tax=Haliotis cracherodii TaxID=6455 RepID=UPI0039E9F447